VIVSDLEGGTFWRFGQLVGLSEQVSRTLNSAGVHRDSVVALSLPSGPEFLTALIGVWSMGGTPLCLPETLVGRELDSIDSRCGIEGLIVSVDSAARLPVPTICMDEFKPEMDLDGCDGHRLLGHLLGLRPPGAPALLLVTSGTTADPKIVELTASALLYRLSENLRVLGTGTLRHTLCTLPLHFGHGLIGNCLTTIYANGDLTMTGDLVQVATRFFEILSTREISFISSVPTFWTMVARMSRNDRQRWHALTVAGSGSAPLNSKIIDGFYAMLPDTRLLNLYGLTEMANWVAGASIRPGEQLTGRVGHCWGGRAAVIRDDETVASSGSGEIVLRSPARMRRYRSSPEATRCALERGWLHTGDLGEIADDGTIVLVGRLVDQINRAGLKVSPAAIENVLIEHPDVADICCFGLSDELRGERVAAAVVRVPGSEVTGSHLRQWLVGRLRSDALPESWFFLGELPRNARGKVLRTELRRRCVEE
jgi:oxalate---CoA ligase